MEYFKTSFIPNSSIINKYLDLAILLILGFLLLPLVNLLPAGNEMKFIFTPLLALLVIIRFPKSELKLQKKDWFWLAFLALCVVSVVDARNLSLSWQPLASWISLILLTILFRQYCQIQKKRDHVIILCKGVFALIAVQVVCAMLINQSITNGSWNASYGGNSNYIAAYLIVLSPIIILYQYRKQLSFGLVLIGWTIVSAVVLYTSLRSGLLVLVVMASLFFIKRFSLKFFLGLMLVISFIIIMSLSHYQDELSARFMILREINGQWKSGRFLFDQLSWQLFRESPFNGVGIGNWYTEVYKNLNATTYELNRIPPFSYPDVIYLRNSHNLYTKILSEVGFLGLVSFVSPVVLICLEYVRSNYELLKKELFWLFIFFAYLLFSIFLATANMSQHLYSELQLFGILSYGLIPSEDRAIETPKWFFLCIKVLLGLCILWSSYSLYANHQYYKAKMHAKNGDIESALVSLEGIRHSGIKEFVSDEFQIDHQLAKWSSENDDKREPTLLYFERAVETNPYNSNLLLDYAHFLVKSGVNDSLAESICIGLLEKHGRNFDSSLLLADIALKEERITDAQLYLEQVNLSPLRATYDRHKKRLDSLKSLMSNRQD